MSSGKSVMSPLVVLVLLLTSMSVSSLDKYINKIGKVTWQFKESKCIKHSKCSEYCSFVIYKNKNDKKYDIIHDKCENILVNKYEFYCSKRKSTKYQLLSQSNNIIKKKPSTTDFLLVNGHEIKKLRYGFVTVNLLLHLNDAAIIGQHKIPGMNY